LIQICLLAHTLLGVNFVGDMLINLFFSSVDRPR